MSDAHSDLLKDEQRYRRQQEQAEALFEAIKHGDEKHRAWLREALHAYFTGQPVPEPR